MNVQEQIYYLRLMASNPKRDPAKCAALSICADTFEKLNAVYEAAKGVDTDGRGNWQALEDALAALEG